ncbi:hypothetical protein ARMSODRAFT_1025975 [Armillaria solidipes]|uniref:Uncharacterized protein n=1 Tax=Armillaria solidipes TaxID=1076256 RepID=A0A2H3B4Y7_9AGAR|nr:hypothetical protein ARMSODRAFT_1025975 [Armillaria solidipes]
MSDYFANGSLRSQGYIVWTNAFKLDILANDYFYPFEDTDLQYRTRHAYRLASRWLAGSPLTPKSEKTFIGSPVCDIKFVSGQGNRWLLTIRDIAQQQKCSEWFPKDAIFTQVRLNADPGSEADVTVADNRAPTSGQQQDPARNLFRRRRPTPGDVIGLSEDISKTLIHNWKTNERAYLDDVGDTRHDYRLQVVFTPPTIFVVRACLSQFTPPPSPATSTFS